MPPFVLQAPRVDLSGVFAQSSITGTSTNRMLASFSSKLDVIPSLDGPDTGRPTIDTLNVSPPRLQKHPSAC